MFGLGMSEIIFLGLLALIVIGPKELPELARTIGRFMNELKRSTNVLTDELKQQARFDINEMPKKNSPPTTVPAEGANAELTVNPTLNATEPQQMSFADPSPDKDPKDGAKNS
ncbi:MAG: twin-arginine translocase TatA/TatE family subunit [Bdellovibrio sp.]|nr:twin-arginine translocase TatA/TatE family subunit [Bdellovibrio sp.]